MNFSAPDHWAKLHIVHCGIEPDRYVPNERTRTKNLLFVGRLAGVKGVPVLLDALKMLKEKHANLEVTLIGDGPERAALESRSQDMGLAQMVDFVGYKSQSDVAETLSNTDIFVLPSFAEGVPVVLMEAMAARVPVITTHVAGIPELIEDGTHGILTHPGDASSLAGAIEKLLSNSALATEMGKTGREKVSAEFNIETEAAWLAELFGAYKVETPNLPVRGSR